MINDLSQSKGLYRNISPIGSRLLLFSILKWLIYIILAILILFLLSSPLRSKLAKNYVSLGDQLLSQKKYLSAQLEYKKALVLKRGNKTALERIDLAKSAEKNVLALEPFYKETNNKDQLDLLEKATAVPRTEKEGVILAKDLILQEEYQLAIIPAKTALEMDSTYEDAEAYMAIANVKIADLVELSPENQKMYREESLKIAKDLLPSSNEVAKIILTSGSL